MEAESIQSLLPLLNRADQWSELLLLLPLLVALEAVLSADNAIALAAISRGLHDPGRQALALNFGLALALVFRLALIAAARWVLAFWPLQLAAAMYLLWLCGAHLVGLWRQQQAGDEPSAELHSASVASSAAALSLVSVVGKLAITDLAFSLDSVAAVVAVSDRLWLVMAGGVLGVIALRLTAGLFVRWLEVYRHLETAGFLAVGLVGVRLLLRLGLPQFLPPEWVLLLAVAVLFAWGFSDRKPADVTP